MKTPKKFTLDKEKLETLQLFLIQFSGLFLKYNIRLWGFPTFTTFFYIYLLGQASIVS